MAAGSWPKSWLLWAQSTASHPQAPLCSVASWPTISTGKGVFVALVAFALLLLAFSYWLKETLPPSKRTHGSVWSGFADYGILLHYKRS